MCVCVCVCVCVILYPRTHLAHTHKIIVTKVTYRVALSKLGHTKMAEMKSVWFTF